MILEDPAKPKKWRVQFEDNFATETDEKTLQSWLVKLPKREVTQRQLDYILVSNRWRASMVNSSVCWGPSIHRNIYGKDDHALVMCRWMWRLRSIKKESGTDWAVLKTIAPQVANQVPAENDDAPENSSCLGSPSSTIQVGACPPAPPAPPSPQPQPQPQPLSVMTPVPLPPVGTTTGIVQGNALSPILSMDEAADSDNDDESDYTLTDYEEYSREVFTCTEVKKTSGP